MNVVELHTDAELREAFPVLRELRTHLDERTYRAQLSDMQAEGYRLFALRDGGRIVAVAGIIVRTNFSHGRHVWVHDLVTTASARSKGYGRRLLEHVEAFARQSGCRTVALSSGLERADAHRFYEQRMGYTRASYSFRKELA